MFIFVESEKTILLVLGAVSLVAVLSLISVFQSLEINANVLYGYKYVDARGFGQRGIDVRQWEAVEQAKGDDGYRRDDIYPRFRYVQPGAYEVGVKGNYNSGRFGGIVPNKPQYAKYVE